MFRRLIDIVQEHRADLFLIAGDLFDHNRVHVPTQNFVLEQLARLSIPVVLIPGNHDTLSERSIYHRFNPRDAGEHVHTLFEEDGAVLKLPDLHATIWGRAMVEHEPATKPMAGVPERFEDQWHIGMAHGYFTPDDKLPRSSLISVDEIRESGFDYLALGHIHVYQDVSQGSTRAVYPGSPAAWLSTKPSVAFVQLHPERGVNAEPVLLAT